MSKPLHTPTRHSYEGKRPGFGHFRAEKRLKYSVNEGGCEVRDGFGA
jgi:hypothetical protein